MPLPNFVIIGAARSGTTSLYRYLAQHPDVFTSPVKETNYFAWEAERPPGGPAPILEQMYPIRSVAAYRALFDEVSGQQAIGEASPRYLHVPGVPERLAGELPDVRLVAILREPARRAYADYMVRRRKGIEGRTFEALIEAEAPRLHEPPLPGSRPILHHGLYHAHLRRWFAVVPPERLLVLLHEDLAADPAGLFVRLCRFLGITEVATMDSTVRYGPAGLARSPTLDRVVNGRLANSARSLLPTVARGPARRLVRWVRRQNTHRPELPTELRARLAELYRDDIRALGKLIGRDLRTWLPNFGDREQHRIEAKPAVGEA
jgi:Sulfotransferase family